MKLLSNRETQGGSLLWDALKGINTNALKSSGMPISFANRTVSYWVFSNDGTNVVRRSINANLQRSYARR